MKIKLFILCLLAALFCGKNIKAQETNLRNVNSPLSFGAYLDGKVGINAAEVPEGTQNHILFGGPDFGIIGYMPFSETLNTGGILEIGYTALPLALKGYNSTETIDYIFRYVTISPQFFLSNFMVGLDVGFHAKTYVNGEATDNFNEMTEGMYTALKLGGMIPVITNDFGRLNVVIRGSYALSGIGFENDAFKWHPASLSLGINYLFNME